MERIGNLKVNKSNVVEVVLGYFGHEHFGHGRFGSDISAMEFRPRKLDAGGGRFGRNHKFWVWYVRLH